MGFRSGDVVVFSQNPRAIGRGVPLMYVETTDPMWGVQVSVVTTDIEFVARDWYREDQLQQIGHVKGRLKRVVLKKRGHAVDGPSAFLTEDMPKFDAARAKAESFGWTLDPRLSS